MSKRLSVLAAFVLISIILSPVVYAQIEYTSGIIAFERYNGIGLLEATYDPIDPKVACTPDNDICVALVYERAGYAGYTAGLKLFHSDGNNPWINGEHFQHLAYSCGTFLGWDSFWAGCSPVSLPAAFTFTDYTSYDEEYDLGSEYTLPYDIIYSGSGSIFYIIFTKDLGQYPTALSTHVYQYDGDLTTPTSLTSAGNLAYVGRINNTHFMGHTCCRYVNDAGFYDYYADWNEHVITTLSLTVRFDEVLVSNDGVSALNCRKMYDFKGFGFAEAGRQYRTHSRTKATTDYGCVNPPATFTVDKTEIAYGGTYTGFDYFDDNYLYFTDDSNATYRVSTDGSSYGSTELIHTWSGGEDINNTDTYVGTTNQVFLWSRGNVSIDGIYAYNEQVYSFLIGAQGLNPISGVPEYISATTQLTCFDQNYSASSSGINAIVTTPCLENNSLTITVASGWNPTSIALLDYDTLSTDSYTVVTTPPNGLGWISDYNYTLRFVDSFSGSPAVGASITVGVETKVTDSNGEVKFFLSPYDSVTFTASELGTSYYLYANGTPRTHDYQFSADNYQNAFGTFTMTDDATPDDVSDFRTSQTLLVDPIFLRLIMDVFTSDGVHYEGDSVVVRVGGALNGTFFDDDGVYIERGYATSFPATFVLIDDRASWTADVNLTQGAYFDSDTIAVTNTTLLYRYDFTLPNASYEQECSSDAGCDTSFCKGSTWYSTGVCSSGICSYTVESCLLCDDAAGCYEATTSESCPTGLDFECVGDNTCVDTKNLRNYKCSSSKQCVWELVECDYQCFEDVCIPSPIVEVCDQSTTVGMLTCMQSGVMGFIGSTYDPIMVLGVVLALVTILVAIFALAFKGATHVIR